MRHTPSPCFSKLAPLAKRNSPLLTGEEEQDNGRLGRDALAAFEPAGRVHCPAGDQRPALLLQLRPVDRAAVEGVGAAGVEGAAAWRPDRRWQLALEADAVLLPRRIGDRRRRQERARVG